MTPKHAQLLAGDLDDETLVRYIDRFLMFYIRTADRLQRTAPWVESLDGGLDHLRDVVCDDSLGLAAEFEAAMARHVDGLRVRMEGRAGRSRQAVAVRLVRQRPRRADPTVVFDESGARKVPVLMGMPQDRRTLADTPRNGPKHPNSTKS